MLTCPLCLTGLVRDNGSVLVLERWCSCARLYAIGSGARWDFWFSAWVDSDVFGPGVCSGPDGVTFADPSGSHWLTGAAAEDAYSLVVEAARASEILRS